MKTTAEIMELLNNVAQKYAEMFGYELVIDGMYNPQSDNHPLNIALNMSVRQVSYKGKESGSYINTRQRFGNPRIDISSPSQEWFVKLEFKNGRISECQIFHELGFEMMPIIKKEIEDKLTDN